MRLIPLFLTALTVLAGALPAPVGASGREPAAIVAEIAERLGETMEARREELQRDRNALNAVIDDVVLRNFDTEYAALLVLGRHARPATPEQRQRFSRAFYDSLVSRYGEALLQYTRGSVRVLPFRGELNERRTTIRTEVVLNDGSVIHVENPAKLPEVGKYQEIREPIITATIFMPQDYVGPVITLCNQKRGNQIDMRYHGRQVQLIYEMPMNEVVMDFFDKLKSVSRGYASLDYDFKEYRTADLVKLDLMVGGEKVDALSVIVHRASAQYRGRELAAKLRGLIPRQMFDVPVQAAIGAHIIARETIKALRKNVLAKCYGGDISRKKKLLEKQKEGKKRMKQVGNVEIPQEAFLAVLRTDEGK